MNTYTVTTAPAADKQVAYVKDLLHSRVVHPEAAARLRATLAAGTLTKQGASLAIDWFRRQPVRPAEVILEDDGNQAEADLADAERAADFKEAAEAVLNAPAAPVTVGVYEMDGAVYKVKPSKAGNLYAMRLDYTVGEAERLTAAGTVIKATYTYAPGIVGRLDQAHRVTGDRANALSILFSSCLVCGRKLSAAQSVARSIGPVCIKRV